MKKFVYSLLAVLLLTAVGIASLIRSDIPVQELKKKYANEHSKFMEINGMNVHYRDEGQGFPLVLIHGTSSSLHTWDGWVSQLQGNFRIIRLDLPGFGLTGPDPKHNYSMESYVSFMKLFLERLKVDSCYMAGNSLGGQITWNIAATYPDLVKKMILIDAAGYPFDPNAIPFVFKLARSPIAPLLSHVTPRFFIAENIKQVYGIDSMITDELIDRYYHLNLREGNRGAFLDLANNIKFENYEKIKTIKTPALIMWGEKDIWMNPKLGKRFKEDLANSVLIVYPGIGHVPMEETPTQTAQDARVFLSGDSIQ